METLAGMTFEMEFIGLTFRVTGDFVDESLEELEVKELVCVETGVDAMFLLDSSLNSSFLDAMDARISNILLMAN